MGFVKDLADYLAFAGAITWGTQAINAKWNIVSAVLGTNAVYGYYVVGAAGIVAIADKTKLYPMKY
jgi:uncharacterized membrane protein YuzA (DUF378 family)